MSVEVLVLNGITIRVELCLLVMGKGEGIVCCWLVLFLMEQVMLLLIIGELGIVGEPHGEN